VSVALPDEAVAFGQSTGDWANNHLLAWVHQSAHPLPDGALSATGDHSSPPLRYTTAFRVNQRSPAGPRQVSDNARPDSVAVSHD
jgi:hypothetical protein